MKYSFFVIHKNIITKEIWLQKPRVITAKSTKYYIHFCDINNHYIRVKHEDIHENNLIIITKQEKHDHVLFMPTKWLRLNN